MSPWTNFENTLQELKRFLAIPIVNDRDRAGVIQAFEFTFEQAWKSIQKMAVKEGLEASSPRKAFAVALANRWIEASQESSYLEMLKDRNLTSHTYHRDLAEKVVNNIQHKYVELLTHLLNRLKSESSNANDEK